MTHVKRTSPKTSRLWIGSGLAAVAGLLVASLAILLILPDWQTRLKRAAKALCQPAPKTPAATSLDDAAIRRQVETRLRAEMEERLEREITALREKSEAEEALKPEDIPSLDEAFPGGMVSDVRKLRSGIAWKSELLLEKGGPSSNERTAEDSYTASYQLKLRLPAAAQGAAALELASPGLSTMLPGLPALINQAKVSPWFDKLIEEKVSRIRRDANRLAELPTKHNLYDCETILHLTASNGRKVFLLQAEMDVVSDGSDGDRLPQMPEEIVNSTHYQPFTSYGWPKRTSTPNPMLEGWEKRLTNAENELELPATSADRKRWLRDRIAFLKRGISDLKGRSFLIAEFDPFIVLPYNLLTSRDAATPNVGDFAVVIHAGRAYPAIVGDGGPTHKVGEASLRLARAINPQATPYSRPVSDLKVTYLVFPQSRSSNRQAPDYEAWRQTCHQLLQEIGGLAPGYELHRWQNLLPETSAQPATPPSSAPAPP